MYRKNNLNIYSTNTIISSPTPKAATYYRDTIPKSHFTTDELLKRCILEVIGYYFNETTIIIEETRQLFCDEIFCSFFEKCRSEFRFANIRYFAKLCRKFDVTLRSDIEIVIFPNGTYEINNLI